MTDFEEYIRQVEPDTVSGSITKILSNDTFYFYPVEYIAIHRQLFTWIYKHAGKIRDYNITKAEWVLDGKNHVVRNDAPAVDPIGQRNERHLKATRGLLAGEILGFWIGFGRPDALHHAPHRLMDEFHELVCGQTLEKDFSHFSARFNFFVLQLNHHALQVHGFSTANEICKNVIATARNEVGSNPEKQTTHAGLLRHYYPRNDDRDFYKLKLAQ